MLLTIASLLRRWFLRQFQTGLRRLARLAAPRQRCAIALTDLASSGGSVANAIWDIALRRPQEAPERICLGTVLFRAREWHAELSHCRRRGSLGCSYFSRLTQTNRLLFPLISYQKHTLQCPIWHGCWFGSLAVDIPLLFYLTWRLTVFYLVDIMHQF